MMEEPPALKQMRKIQLIQQALAILRQDKLRGFRIDIETDSTIQANADAEKENRIEFIKGVTDFIGMASTVGAGDPDFAPLAGKMLSFVVRGFRVGRDLEAAIEEFCDKAQQQAKTAQKPPNPEEIKANAEMMKAQAEIQRQQIENQGENTNAQIELRMKELDVEMKKMEMAMRQMDMRIKAAEMEHGRVEIAHKQRELGMKTVKELGGDSDQMVDPHVHMLAQAAKAFEIASRRHAAPKEIIRDKNGKARHIITHFQE